MSDIPLSEVEVVPKSEGNFDDGFFEDIPPET